MPVSVVIPTHDRAELLPRAVNSVLAQTCPPHEIIVVDDGSTDATQRVVAAYGDQVRYLRRARGGVAAARNTGTHAAKPEWIAFLDSDDEWLPRKLEPSTP